MTAITAAAKERLIITAPLLIFSAAAWMLLATTHTHGMHIPALCSTATNCLVSQSVSLDLILSLNPPGILAWGWALMLIAMMIPLLAPPLQHLRNRSLARHRIFNSVLFISAYFLVWMLAGLLLMAAAFVLRTVLVDPAAPMLLALLIALSWQMSPAKQTCLNRCHTEPNVSGFGLKSRIDILRHGITSGFWCVGSCWALMFIPFFIPQAHVAIMVMVSLWIWGEALERPVQPQWKWRWPAKAIRLSVAQSMQKLKIN